MFATSLSIFYPLILASQIIPLALFRFDKCPCVSSPNFWTGNLMTPVSNWGQEDKLLVKLGPNFATEFEFKYGVVYGLINKIRFPSSDDKKLDLLSSRNFVVEANFSVSGFLNIRIKLTNKKPVFRSRDFLLTNQRPVFALTWLDI